MSSTDADWGGDEEAAGVEGVELHADPSARVTLDAELMQLLFTRGAGALTLADRQLPGDTFFSRPVLPTPGLREMEAGGMLTAEGFVAAAAAWHEGLHGAPLPDALRQRLAEIAVELADGQAEGRAVPDHIYTLY
jgi:hypothetical protein